MSARSLMQLQTGGLGNGAVGIRGGTMVTKTGQVAATVGVLMMAASASYAADTAAVKKIHVFNGADGSTPYASLANASDGSLYGTTLFGGAYGSGTTYRIGPAGDFTSLFSFADGGSSGAGNQPLAGLLQGMDGNFYGTTSSGGLNSAGTVFQMTPSGQVSVVYSLGTFVTSTCCAGDGSAGTLILGSDGDLYGTTELGGNAVNGGMVFKVNSTGAFTPLYEFSGSDGLYPATGLTLGSDGNFYGTTLSGGTWGYGTVFKMTPSGGLTTLYSFTNGADGAYPRGQLVQASDGNLYGTTSGNSNLLGGPIASPSSVFKIAPSGLYTTLYSNGTSYSTIGLGVYSGLIQAGDGNLYGTASGGGVCGHGTIFKVALDGSVTQVYSFSGGDGSEPVSGVAQAGDGSFYGTTQDRSVAGYGSVYQLSLGTSAVGNPTCLLATAGDAQVSLSWNPILGATSYNVYAGTASGAEAVTPFATGVTATSQTISGLNNGTTYYFEVSAVNASAVSPPSNEAVATPSPVVAPPTFSPAGGTYRKAQTVSITDATIGSTIYYTTDGNAPTTSSTKYTGSFTVSTSETVRAFAVETGYKSSDIVTVSYTIGHQKR